MARQGMILEMTTMAIMTEGTEGKNPCRHHHHGRVDRRSVEAGEMITAMMHGATLLIGAHEAMLPL